MKIKIKIDKPFNGCYCTSNNLLKLLLYWLTPFHAFRNRMIGTGIIFICHDFKNSIKTLVKYIIQSKWLDIRFIYTSVFRMPTFNPIHIHFLLFFYKHIKAFLVGIFFIGAPHCIYSACHFVLCFHMSK